MARNPVTARERRGLLAVAAVSLLVVGCGYAMRTCRNASVPMAPPVEVMTDDGRFVTADSTGGHGGDTVAKRKRSGSAGSGRKRGKRKDSTARRKRLPSRSHLDEEL